MVRTSFFIFILTLASCANEVSRSIEAKSTAFGKLNEIVVIADDDIWQSEVGDTFKYYFESAYPILPQPEPFFDLRQFSTDDLTEEPLRKELRTYAILADISDPNSRTTQMVKKDLGEEKFNELLKSGQAKSSIGKDKWARGQLLVYLLGHDNQALITNIKNSFPAISKRVNDHDKNIIESSIYAVELENKGLSKLIANRYGIEMKIPGKFEVALDEPDDKVLWIRKDDKGMTMSFLIKKIPYTKTEQLNLESLISLRNDLGEYVSTNSKGSKMVVNNTDLPVYEYNIKIDDHYTKELRGVWEINNDFLGGAFASYAIVKDAVREIIFIDAFVYAPGKEKRDMMQKLDFIVKNAKVSAPTAEQSLD